MNKKAMIIGISLAVTAGLAGLGFALERSHDQEHSMTAAVSESAGKGYGREELGPHPFEEECDETGTGSRLGRGKGEGNGAGTGVGRSLGNGGGRGNKNGRGAAL